MSDVFIRLKEREEARVSALEHRRAEKQEGKRVEETVEYFTQQLQSKKSGRLAI